METCEFTMIWRIMKLYFVKLVNIFRSDAQAALSEKHATDTFLEFFQKLFVLPSTGAKCVLTPFQTAQSVKWALNPRYS